MTWSLPPEYCLRYGPHFLSGLLENLSISFPNSSLLPLQTSVLQIEARVIFKNVNTSDHDRDSLIFQWLFIALYKFQTAHLIIQGPA